MMDRSIFRLKGVRPVMLLLAICSLLQAAAVIGQSLWLAEAVTLLFSGRPGGEAVRPLVWFAASFVLRHTFAWLERIIAGTLAEHTSERVRQRLLERLFALGPGYASRHGSGRLVTLALDGVTRFRTYLELTLPRMLDMAFITLPLLLIVYTMDATSGVILTVTMPVLIAFFILLGLTARKLADRQWKSYQVLSHHFTDSLRGLETLRFLGLSRGYAAAVEKVSDQYRSATVRTLRVAFLSSFALDFFSTLSVAFVAVSLGLRLIHGGIGLETALAVLLIAPEYYTPVRMLGSDYHASLDGKEAWGTIRRVLDGEPSGGQNGQDPDLAWMEKDTEGGADAGFTGTEPDPAANMGTKMSGRGDGGEEGTGSTAAASFNDGAASGLRRSETNSGAVIELINVEVQGDEGEPRLSGLTAAIGKEVRKVGIVGMSGAGKTTLLNLLGGFLEPSSGTVLVDGRPLAGEVKREWQRQLTYIPQHPYLFSGTLADNVRFYEPDSTDEQVMQALEAVGLGSLVRQLPRGIHERIGEGGRTLSGGQAHRVALARALAGGRSVLLLDEPTAHLDIETELELKETMLSVFGSRYVFLATHRLHWMKEMDWIWVLKDGRLAESGTHEQLKARSGFYRELLEATWGRGSH